MQQSYFTKDQRLWPLSDTAESGTPPVIWVDLMSPSEDEKRAVEGRYDVEIPTHAEMQEIEPSARLYGDGGASYMTLTGLLQQSSDTPEKTVITFILKGRVLITVRHAEPRAFAVYPVRAQKPQAVACDTGEDVMLGLLEAMTDRMADTLERAGSEVDRISQDVFRHRSDNARAVQQDLRSILVRIGTFAELLTMVQESLVSVARLIAFHVAGEGNNGRGAQQMTRLIERDAAFLGEHARALSTKINFLLDATLGMINLEQNQIIKIFSVAAVVFLPPTLVASIYGMNFAVMPELTWPFGYPFALGMMVVSAVLPYLYFKRRGWL